jgi:hypothetical protein
MRIEIKKTMSFLGSIKTAKKAKASRENGIKGGRPLSGVSKTCLTCGNVFYIPRYFKDIITDSFPAEWNRLEMFARVKESPSWNYWGNEIEGDIELN